MSQQELKKSSGFSLVEVMVASGILMILVAVISAVMVNANSEAAGVQLKLDYVNLGNQLATAFRTDSSCLNNFTQNSIVFPAGNMNLTSVKNYNSGGTSVGDVVGALNTPVTTGSRLSVTSIVVTNVQTLIANSEYVVSVQINIQHSLATTHQFKPILVEGIRVNTTGAGVVTACLTNSKLTCVTGFLKAQDPTPTGGSIRSNSDPAFAPTFSDVFTVINTGTRWGLQCNTLGAHQWIISGCSSSGLLNSGASGPRQTVDSTFVPNACLYETASIPPVPTPGDGIYTVCCTTR